MQRLERTVTIEWVARELFGAPWVNKLHLIFRFNTAPIQVITFTVCYEHFPGDFFGYLVIVCYYHLFQPTQSNEALFEPDYYWGLTVFRSKPWSHLYLRCDAGVDKLATLVPMEKRNYPNLQALFIV